MPLLASTFLIALVDGFNPCSLWALSILLALVLRSGSRRRVMAVGLMFLGVTTALYGFYIVGMFGALTYAAGAAWVRLSMAAIALVFGLINLKDFFWFKRGPSLTISERAKPRLYARMRHVADAKRPLAGVLAGTAGLAVGVSLLETPCTAGYPLLWANLLSDQGVGWAGAAGLFAVYMAVFLADELAIFGTAVVAMRAAKLEERAGRLLKLIGGALMVTLAITLVAYPAALETLAGAMAVFGFAALAVVVVLGAERVFRGRSRALTR
jgi:cytochrome c biogenesis protein CcdA